MISLKVSIAPKEAMSRRAVSLRRQWLRPNGCARSRDCGRVSRDHYVADIPSGDQLKRFATSSPSSSGQTGSIFYSTTPASPAAAVCSPIRASGESALQHPLGWHLSRRAQLSADADECKKGNIVNTSSAVCLWATSTGIHGSHTAYAEPKSPWRGSVRPSSSISTLTRRTLRVRS